MLPQQGAQVLSLLGELRSHMQCSQKIKAKFLELNSNENITYQFFKLYGKTNGEGDGTLLTPSTLAWKIPWIEELGRLQSMGSLRVGHD